jgi:hypothetical protein
MNNAIKLENMSDLKKIPLKDFIENLIGLHTKGVNFIDIITDNADDENQDTIIIAFEQSYLTMDSEFNETVDKQNKINKGRKDEIDFNELM